MEGRVTAIAKAHGLLTQAGQGEVSLRAIVETELAPYGREKGNLEIDGQQTLKAMRDINAGALSDLAIVVTD